MTVLAVKLVTGEEIIADVTNTQDNRIKLTNPVQLRMVPPQVAGGQPSMGFVPFPNFAEQKSGNSIVIEPLHVVYTYTLDEQISMQYNSVFGSGIITPTRQLIL